MATKPTIALIPSGYGTNKVYSVLPSDGSGDFTFGRTGTATRINKDKLIESVGSNIPRIDYTDSGCPSLLLEPQRTNFVTYSEDFSNTAWNTGATRSVNFVPTSTIDPNGKTNAYRVTSTASNNQVAIIPIIISGQIYTNSIYVRRVYGSGNVILRNVNNQENHFQVSVNDGWKRIETTATALTQFGRLYVNLYTVGDIIEIWGGQVELGSFGTSIIPTTGTSVTRIAETATGSGNADTFNDSEGVLMVETSALISGGSTRVISLSSGSQSVNNIYFNFNPNGTLSCQVLTSGGNNNLSTSSINQENNNKILVKYKANDFALWVNGFEADIDTSLSSTPIGLDRLNFDFGSGSFDFYGKTKQLQYYNTALTDLELETLTSFTSFNAMALALNYTIY